MSDIRDAHQMQTETFEKALNDLQYSLNQANKDFEKFKEQTDLDGFFTKGIDVEQRKRVLQSIKELMADTDWNEVDKELVRKQEPKDTSYHLESIKTANKQLKHNIMQILKANKGHDDLALPVHLFSEELDTCNENNLEQAVKITADVANDFYN